jgi:lipid-A-disaccharide synthase
VSAGELLIVLNGPGEVSAWLHPFVQALRQRAPDVPVACALVPCVYASGQEGAVLRSMPGIAAVSEPRPTMRYLTTGRAPDGFRCHGPAVVLHLGGEAALSVGLARRRGAPLLAYAEGRLPFERWFERIFLVHPLARPAPARYAVVGDLMVDAARQRCPRRAPAPRQAPAIGLFPGSREYQARHMVPFLTRVAGVLSAWLPGARFMLARSEYISAGRIRDLAAARDELPLDHESARWEDDGAGGTLVSEVGVRLAVRTAAEVMAEATLVVTIPGSNTGELAALGVPMIVVIPTQHGGETHPAPGVLGHLDRLPLIGPSVKLGLMHAWLHRNRFVSIPNRRAGRLVVPEIVGRVSSLDIAGAARRALASAGNGLARELVEIMGEPGAAARLADAVLAALRSAAATATT